jgi:glutamate N-acetyltransferase / amino-acid N-acetyltransferase
MSITAPNGFVASAVACGIKSDDVLDLALVATEDARPVVAAGVFTQNLAAAAPVIVSKAHLASTAGRCGAVVLSSGNANAATGSRGVADAERICVLAAGQLGLDSQEVLLCQTGLIGNLLPMQQIEKGIVDLVAARESGDGASKLAARAIMTTDTHPKEVVVEGHGYLVGGIAKGAAMLAPNMATMLAVLTTDAACQPAQLHACLTEAVERTFNRTTVDGCTSTNDTVLVLASGRSGEAPGPDALTPALERACDELANMMAADAEGGTKKARISVSGAASKEQAARAARKVADSMLVKCSLNGEDPYWGRVVSELGSAGVVFDMDRVEVAYGGTTVCRGGVAADHDEEAVRAHMKKESVEIECQLNLGTGSATVVSCDLGYGYIDENRSTS